MGMRIAEWIMTIRQILGNRTKKNVAQDRKKHENSSVSNVKVWNDIQSERKIVDKDSAIDIANPIECLQISSVMAESKKIECSMGTNAEESVSYVEISETGGRILKSEERILEIAVEGVVNSNKEMEDARISEVLSVINEDIGEGIIEEEFTNESVKQNASAVVEQIAVIEHADNFDIEENVEDKKIKEIQQKHIFKEEIDESVQSEDKKADLAEKEDIFIGNSITDNDVEGHLYTRSQLEEMYEDTIQLIIKPENPMFSKELRLVEDTNEYTHLRNRIMNEFKSAKLLCEIELNDEEFNLICTYFKKRYVYIRRDVGQPIVDILFCVALVQMGIRYYDGNFWKHIVRVLWDRDDKDIPINQRAWIGGTFTQTMLAFGKPIFKENEYVTNVMLHCFVVDNYASKFFEFLFQYYELDLERTITTSAVEESEYICNSIKNPYGKRKQYLSNYMYLSIRGNEVYSRMIVSEILRLIDQSFWDEYVDTAVEHKLARKYLQWYVESDYFKKKQNEGRTEYLVGHRTKKYRAPHLVCDLEKSTFKLILPMQIIPDNLNTETIKWRINGKQEVEVKCAVDEGYTVNKTKEIVLSIDADNIFADVKFSLLSEERELRCFYWQKCFINFFNSMGEWVRGENLTDGLYYAFSKEDVSVETEGLLSVSNRAGMLFYEFNFALGNLLNINGQDNYYIGKVHEIGLTEENVIQGMSIVFNDKKVPVYRKMPSLVVDIVDGKFDGTAVIVNDKVSRLCEKDFVDIQLGRKVDKKIYFIDLKSVAGIKEGRNDIVIDFPASTRRIHCEFGFLPQFEYFFEDAPYIFQNRGTLVVNKVIKGTTIKLNNDADKQQYDFSVEDINNGILSLEMEINSENVQVDFEIPMLEYSWDKVNWCSKKMDDIWHTELKDIVYIKYPATRLSLSLREQQGGMPAFIYHKSANGIFECDITKIRTYLSREKMFHNIVLLSADAEYDIFRIIMKSYLKSATLKADYEHESVSVACDVIGRGDYYIDIICGSQTLVEKKHITDETLDVLIPIKSAEYTLEVYETISNSDFGFDDDYEFVGKKVMKLVNPLELVDTCLVVDTVETDEEKLLKLELNGKYMLFIAQQLERHKYWGILVQVFHNNIIRQVSTVIVRIPDLNAVTRMSLMFIDSNDGEEYEFLYDNYTHCVEENENPSYSKSEAYRRYEYVLYEDSFYWNMHFINKDKQIEKKAYERIKQKKEVHKSNSIWKNEVSSRDILLEDMDFSMRIYNALTRANIRTVGDIIKKLEDGSIVKVRNLGQKQISEIVKTLKEKRYY